MAVAAVAAGALRIGSMFARGAGSVLSGGARGVGRSGGMLRRAVLKKTKVKRENIARSRSFNKKLMERNKRRQKEKTIETFSIKKPKLGSIPGKSFFEKILDFIGTLFLGWLFNNLPKIIKFVQDLIKRINLLIDNLKSFVENVGKWFTGLKNVVVAGWENIKNFDFTDSEGKLKSALTEMDGAFKGMQTDVEGMKNALTADMSGETSGGGADASGGAVSIDDPNARALLNAIAEAEGTSKYQNQGYNTQFTGTQFNDLSKHPEQIRSSNGLSSDAAGRYQFLSTTWKSVMGGAMTPSRQDEAALKLTSGRGVNIKNGLSLNEIYKLGGEWASIEGGPQMRKGGSYGSQAKYSAEKFLQMYQKYGGKVEGQEGGSGGRYGGGGNVVEYLTGDRRHPNFEYNGHGRESNYHDHIAFKTLQEKERAKAALRAAGIQIGSEYRPGDPGWHGANLAIDVPGAQWGGSGAIGQREYNGSARVRQVLTNAGFGGAGLGHGSSAVSRSPGMIPDIGYSTGPQNTIIIIEEEAPPPMMMGQSEGSSPVIVMGASLNSIMKRKLLTDLAYT